MQNYKKAFLSLALLLLMLCGCGTVKAPPEQGGAVVPEDYASVVMVTINPEIKLFLDADHTILAAEFLNEDARTAYSGLELSGKSLGDGLSEIVETAIEKEYLKPDADIQVTVSEPKGAFQDRERIITLAEAAVNKVLNEKSFPAHFVVNAPVEEPLIDPDPATIPTDTDSDPAEPGSEPSDSGSGTTCENCDGTGKCPDCQGGTMACPACRGTGYETCTNCDANGMQKCPNSHLCRDGKCECQNCHGAKSFVCNLCGGSGKDPADATLVCHDCNGNGTQNCPICRGTGYEICTHCQGTGKVRCEICGGTHQWQCSHCRGAKTAMDCPVCGGSFQCHTCGGSGILQ